MRDNVADWSRDSFFAVHNWWHLALCHLELEQIDEVLRLFDGPIYGKRSEVILDMIDASAMLWRLHLRGIGVGDRWEALADNWTPHVAAGNYAFNDLHTAMAFVGSQRAQSLQALLETQGAAMQGNGYNDTSPARSGTARRSRSRRSAPATTRRRVRRLRSIRNIAHRFGGSHAQRDLLDLTLIEASFRAGNAALAAALAAERLAVRPQSPLAQLFVRRGMRLAQAA